MRWAIRVTVLAAVASLCLLSRPARSEQALAAAFPFAVFSVPTSIFSTYATVPLLTTGTVGAIIYFVVKSQQPQKPQGGADAGGGYVMNEQDARTFAALYLRQTGLQLGSDIADGEGPELRGLATVLLVPLEHQALFAATLHADRDALVPLCGGGAVEGERAARLFERIGVDLWSQPVLRNDVQQLITRISG